MDHKKHTWIKKSESRIFETQIFTAFKQERTSSETQAPHDFYVLRSRPWCNIIAVTPRKTVVFVRQHRVGVDEHTLEIPGGVCDDSDVSPPTAAIRELEEETGYTLASGARAIDLGFVHSNPALFDNETHSIIVGPVERTQGQNLDPGEMIEVIEVPIAEIPDLIVQGKIRHALVLNAFLLLGLRPEYRESSLTRALLDFA